MVSTEIGQGYNIHDFQRIAHVLIALEPDVHRRGRGNLSS